MKIKKYQLATILLLGLFFGCDEKIEVKHIGTTEDTSQRFEVYSYGEFNAGYGNNKREILVVKDTKTDVEYLAITGCGTTELITETHVVGETSYTTNEEE